METEQDMDCFRMQHNWLGEGYFQQHENEPKQKFPHVKLRGAMICYMKLIIFVFLREMLPILDTKIPAMGRGNEKERQSKLIWQEKQLENLG